MAKQTYLHKRAKSTAYYFRCRIPKDLTCHFKDSREITFSLQTHDYHEATRMVSIEAGKWQAKFEQLRRSTTSAKTLVKRLDYSDAEIERLCLLWKHCVLETDDQQRLDGYESDALTRYSVVEWAGNMATSITRLRHSCAPLCVLR